MRKSRTISLWKLEKESQQNALVVAWKHSCQPQESHLVFNVLKETKKSRAIPNPSLLVDEEHGRKSEIHQKKEINSLHSHQNKSKWSYSTKWREWELKAADGRWRKLDLIAWTMVWKGRRIKKGESNLTEQKTKKATKMGRTFVVGFILFAFYL